MWEKRLFFLSSRTMSESPAQLGAKGGQLCLCPCPAAGGTLPFQATFSVAASFQLQILPSFFVLPLFSLHFSTSVVSLSVLVFGFCFFFFSFYFTSMSFPSWFLFFTPLPSPPCPSLHPTLCWLASAHSTNEIRL